jgi:Zn-finger nucleic acid-binding protein
VWLDTGELAAIIGADRAEHLMHRMPVSGQRSDLMCPRCATCDFAQIHTNVGSIVRCNDCGGVFIDGDTLDTIAIDEHEIRPELNGVCKTAIGITWGVGDFVSWLSMFFPW